MTEVKIKKLFADVKEPVKADEGSAGYDIHAYLQPSKIKVLVGTVGIHLSKGHLLLPPKSKVGFGTGLSTEFPKNMVLELHLRSSAGIKKHLRLLNGTGIIDSSYRGEIMIFVENTSETQTVEIKHGERILQALFKSLPQIELEFVDELSDTERGAGGFGSSGEM